MMPRGMARRVAGAEAAVYRALDAVARHGEGAAMMKAPSGFAAVEWADGTVHAIDTAQGHEGFAWRAAPVCGASEPGVSSDREGRHAMRAGLWVDCPGCVEVLA